MATRYGFNVNKSEHDALHKIFNNTDFEEFVNSIIVDSGDEIFQDDKQVNDFLDNVATLKFKINGM